MQARFLWRAFKARWRDQRAELSIIRDHISPGDTVCDVGAHKGTYTYWLSRWVGNSGRVLAFEPQPSLAAYLRRTVPLHNVVVEQKALWSETGALDLFVPVPNSPGASLVATAGGSDGTRLQVPVVALDDYLPPEKRVSLLKVDAEGAELAIFRGARRILDESRPLLVFECENRHLAHGSVEDVFAFLTDAGYDGYFFAPGGVRPLSAFDAAIHQKQAGSRFWDAKDYCNNFLFRPRRQRHSASNGIGSGAL
jgi:FkbM family methyltransferase